MTNTDAQHDGPSTTSPPSPDPGELIHLFRERCRGSSYLRIAAVPAIDVAVNGTGGDDIVLRLDGTYRRPKRDTDPYISTDDMVTYWTEYLTEVLNAAGIAGFVVTGILADGRRVGADVA